MTSFPCPIGEAMRASGGGSGIGGQTITACPLCGGISANTAMRRHQSIEIRALVDRLAATEDLAGMFGPGVDLVSVYLNMEKQQAAMEKLVKDLTRQLDDARRLALPASTSPEGDLSERHTHCGSCSHEAGEHAPVCEKGMNQGKPCGCRTLTPRPSAYDMPVGSVVVADYDGQDDVTYERHAIGWVADDGGAGVQPSATIEGLFTDGLVTEWRLP